MCPRGCARPESYGIPPASRASTPSPMIYHRDHRDHRVVSWFPRFLAVLCASLCPLWLESAVLAQSPEIAGLLPSGGPRGQVTKVEIAGKNLMGARIHLAGSGITVKSSQVNPAGD